MKETLDRIGADLKNLSDIHDKLAKRFDKLYKQIGLILEDAKSLRVRVNELEAFIKHQKDNGNGNGSQ